jgi:hypothetical protein
MAAGHWPQGIYGSALGIHPNMRVVFHHPAQHMASKRHDRGLRRAVLGQFGNAREMARRTGDRANGWRLESWLSSP